MEKRSNQLLYTPSSGQADPEYWTAPMNSYYPSPYRRSDEVPRMRPSACLCGQTIYSGRPSSAWGSKAVDAVRVTRRRSYLPLERLRRQINNSTTKVTRALAATTPPFITSETATGRLSPLSGSSSGPLYSG